MLMILEGSVVSTPQQFELRQLRIDLKSLEPLSSQNVVYGDETTFG